MHVLNPAPDTVRSLANRVFAGRGACVTRGRRCRIRLPHAIVESVRRTVSRESLHRTVGMGYRTPRCLGETLRRPSRFGVLFSSVHMELG